MTWTKTDDDYPDRLLDVSDAAYRLHHAATTYSNRVGTDGRIPKSRLTQIPVPSRTRRAKVIRELETAGLWAADEVGWTLVDFFPSQLSAEEARLTAEYNAVRERERLAKDAQNKASFGRDRALVLERLQAAREQRKAQSGMQGGMPSGMTPLRLEPLRSAPRREQEREQASSADGLRAAASKPGCELCDVSLHDRQWRLYVWEDEPASRMPIHDDCASNVDVAESGRLISVEDYNLRHGRVPA